MNPQVDAYLSEGCGRCPLGGTPECKIHSWRETLEALRRIVLECGLTEERKWGVPCYTYRNGNVILLSALKEYCAISFIKGALMSDAHGILISQTENVQSARIIRFTKVREVLELEPVLKEYIYEAVEVEKAGLKVQFKPVSAFPVPEELQSRLETDPALKAAFEALTPGRQKGYLLHFSQPKQSKTREARIEKCMPKIFAGKGVEE